MPVLIHCSPFSNWASRDASISPFRSSGLGKKSPEIRSSPERVLTEVSLTGSTWSFDSRDRGSILILTSAKNSPTQRAVPTLWYSFKEQAANGTSCPKTSSTLANCWQRTKNSRLSGGKGASITKILCSGDELLR